MKQRFNIKDVLTQIPPTIATELQYYYRRGRVLYFRSTTNQQCQFRMIVSSKLIKKAIAQLTFNGTYKCGLEQ